MPWTNSTWNYTREDWDWHDSEAEAAQSAANQRNGEMLKDTRDLSIRAHKRTTVTHNQQPTNQPSAAASDSEAPSKRTKSLFGGPAQSSSSAEENWWTQYPAAASEPQASGGRTQSGSLFGGPARPAQPSESAAAADNELWTQEWLWAQSMWTAAADGAAKCALEQANAHGKLVQLNKLLE